MAPPQFRPGDIVRIRDARWMVVRVVPDGRSGVLHVRGCERANGGIDARFILPAEPVDRLPHSKEPQVVTRRQWRHVARSVLANAAPEHGALRTVAGAACEILPFQLEPALAVTRGLGTRILIADAVGLGKTIQAAMIVCEVLCRTPRQARGLVVCPAGVRDQWHHEFRTRFHREAATLDAAALARWTALSAAANPWAAHELVIASIDYLKRAEVVRALEPMVWDVAVFDEAHALSGRSDRRTAAAAIAERARTVVLLTATPHSGDDEQFLRLAQLGDLREGFPLVVFRRTRADAGLCDRRKTRWLRVRPSAGERRLHDALIAYASRVVHDSRDPGAQLAMGVLVRRAFSCADSLARSVARRIALLGHALTSRIQPGLPFHVPDDDEPMVELGAPGLADSDDERAMLERILVLAADAARDECKIRVLRRLLRRARQPAIVFTEYRDTLVHLEAALGEFEPVLIHGGMPVRERDEHVHEFTTGGRALLLATDAASEGLNLHYRCRLVINLELPWTPLRLEQRIGRVDRLGQPRPVHAVHLVTRDTREETAVARLCGRVDRAQRAMNAMRVPACDLDVLRLVIADDDAIDLPGVEKLDHAHPPAANVLAPDFRVPAAREAARIEAARRLQPPGPVAYRTRVAIAVRRRREHPARWYSAFHLRFLDREDREYWDTVVGTCGNTHEVPRAAKSIRRLAGVYLRLTADDMSNDAGQRLQALVREIDPIVALASARERAILERLHERRGHIALLLVQPGLFDTRTDRAAAVHEAVFREATSRCEDRLADLEAARNLRVSDPEPLFALVLV